MSEALKMDVTLLSLAYTYMKMKSAKTGEEFTIVDVLESCKKILARVDLINGKSKTKKLIFTEAGLEVDKKWLQVRLESWRIKGSDTIIKSTIQNLTGGDRRG